MIDMELADSILDRARQGLMIEVNEARGAVNNLGGFKKLEEFLFARGYSKEVRAMDEVYVKRRSEK